MTSQPSVPNLHLEFVENHSFGAIPKQSPDRDTPIVVEGEIILKGDFVVNNKKMTGTLREKKLVLVENGDDVHSIEVLFTPQTRLVVENPQDVDNKEFSPLTIDELPKIYSSTQQKEALFRLTINNADIVTRNIQEKTTSIVLFAHSEVQRHVWERYLKSTINSSLLEPFDFYLTIDQFAPLIQIIKETSCEDFVALFQQVGINHITDTLVNSIFVIFEYLKKDVFTLTKAAILDEIRHCTQTETLFRRNSISSKLVTVVLKVFGKKFLHNVLKEVLEPIAKENKKREIDPTKGVEPQEIAENAEFYNKTVSTILTNLFNNIEEYPMELRQVLEYTGQVANEKFPGKESICMGGLFFLRFFNPSIVAPMDSGLLSEPPQANAIRSFILISKILQNIANNVKISTTAKEAFMLSVAHVVEDNILKEQIFFTDLTKDLKAVERCYEVNEEHFLRALQVFQKGFRNVLDFNSESTKWPLFQKLLQSIILNLKDYSILGKEGGLGREKDDAPVPISIRRKEKPHVPTLHNTIALEDSSLLILRPITISTFEDSNLDSALDVLKDCILKITGHIQGVLDRLRLGEDINSIGDENRRGNEIIGHYVRLRLGPILCRIFNDGIITEDGHVWNILKKIAKSETLMKTLNAIDRDVRVDEHHLTNDVKFTYFICECVK